MGYKSKATKQNKANKADRAPIKRAAKGYKWNGVATHMPKSEWASGKDRGTKGNTTQGAGRANINAQGDNWTKGPGLETWTIVRPE